MIQVKTVFSDASRVPTNAAEALTAAPSQQQAPINWVYPLPPNPYNLQRRLTGYVNQPQGAITLRI